MTKSATVRARIDDTTKARVEKILNRVGVSASEAINLLWHQIELQGGLPFEVRIPNKQTARAMRELDAGKGERFDGSAKDALDAMERSLK